MIYNCDCKEGLRTLTDDSIDLLVTDPPYGIGFMGKDWDRALPDKAIWAECLRVLKAGSFAFVMSTPRADCLSRMIIGLEDAGFRVNFTPIFWAYASGFPKAQNIAKQISKAIDNIKQKMYNSSIWNTNLNDVKSAELLYLSDLIEAGLLTTSSDFVAEDVMQYLKTKSINVSVSIAERNLSEVPPTLNTNTFIVPENVGILQKQSLSSVPIATLSLGDQNPRTHIQLIFVPVDVQTFICEKVESKIKEGVVQRIENGKPKSWNEIDINALCVEAIEGLRLTTLNQLRSILNCDTKSQMELPSATNVIITKSIRECLLTKTANILGKNISAQFQEKGYNYQGSARGSGFQNEKYWGFGIDVTKPTTPQAKALDSSYGGFQPKPAVEVIIVAMKPLSEKTFVDQALKNRKGITWLDDGRIPTTQSLMGGGYQDRQGTVGTQHCERNVMPKGKFIQPQGRFPANLLVSDDVLNTGQISKSAGKYKDDKLNTFEPRNAIFPLGYQTNAYASDSGSFSRYLDLDKWAQKTFPFLIVPKASKSEKNKGCEGLEPQSNVRVNAPRDNESDKYKTKLSNNHPTIKPLKLMSYLITLGSRAGDTVLDPFVGTGTTGLACQLLNREFIGYEIDKDYFEIATQRCNHQGVLDALLG